MSPQGPSHFPLWLDWFGSSRLSADGGKKWDFWATTSSSSTDTVVHIPPLRLCHDALLWNHQTPSARVTPGDPRLSKCPFRSWSRVTIKRPVCDLRSVQGPAFKAGGVQLTFSFSNKKNKREKGRRSRPYMGFKAAVIWGGLGCAECGLAGRSEQEADPQTWGSGRVSVWNQSNPSLHKWVFLFSVVFFLLLLAKVGFGGFNFGKGQIGFNFLF